jgi:Glycosyl hydrolases family 28
MQRRSLLALGAATLSLPAAAYAARRAAAAFDARKYGARGDGRARDTAALQRAVDAAFDAGGGTVRVGPGKYLTGTVVLKSNVTLYLEAGATLLGSTDLADYAPQGGPNPHSDANVHHLIFARDAENVTLCGAGRIDGQGRSFWRPSPRLQKPEDFWHQAISNSNKPLEGNARPSPMVEFVRCTNLHIQDVTLANSAGWTLRPVECTSVFIRAMRIRNPIDGPNTDGIDVTACRNVFISDCDIQTGDDAICLKSEAPYGGAVQPNQNITVTNCVLTGCCNGLKFGTGTQGAFENVTFSNSVIYNRDDAPLNSRIISGVAVECVDGGSVHGVVVSNIRMQNTRTPIFIRLGNRGGNPPSGPKPGALRGVMIENVHAAGATLTSSITGLPGHDVEDITLSNIHIETVEGGEADWASREVPELPAHYPEAFMYGRLPAYGFYCRHVKGLRMENVCVEARKPDARPLLICDDVKRVEVAGLEGAAPTDGQPMVVLRGVRGAFVRGCWAPPHTATFLAVEGEDSAAISLVGNALSEAAKPVETRKGATEHAVTVGS